MVPNATFVLLASLAPRILAPKRQKHGPKMAKKTKN